MNTTTKTELSAVTGTEIAILPPAQRAAVVLKSEVTRKELAELVKQSAGIVSITNGDGREEAHRAGMVLKNTRVAIEKTGKAAREDATAFSKAVIAEEKALVDLIAPEEDRVLKLRDGWDAKVEAEKQAKIAAERARVEKIQDRITAVRNLPAAVAGKSGAEISQMILELASTITPNAEYEATFEEFEKHFRATRTEVLDLLAKAETNQLGIESAARAAEQERQAEIARMAAEREELARLRAEQAERERLAKIETDRIAAEQAAEAVRLEAARREQEAELQRQRDAEAGRVRAEQEERDRVAAETKRQLEAQQAAIAAERRALDDAKAEAEAERVRLQVLADRHLADSRLPLPESVTVHDALIDAGIAEGPDDDEIIALVAGEYGMSRGDAIERLAKIDFAAARGREAA
jgi:hypothetical protein